MVNETAAQARTRIGPVVAATAVVMAAWCLPVLASSGIDIRCPQAESALENPLSTMTPALASHNDSALRVVLDAETLRVPAIAETAAESNIESANEVEAVDDQATPTVSTPAISTRLPGVPESSLPSFRRHMHRTDI